MRRYLISRYDLDEGQQRTGKLGQRNYRGSTNDLEGLFCFDSSMISKRTRKPPYEGTEDVEEVSRTFVYLTISTYYLTRYRHCINITKYIGYSNNQSILIVRYIGVTSMKPDN